MEFNSALPVLVTAVITILLVSAGAGLALWWDPRPRIRLLVRRVWFAVTALCVLGVAIFLTGTALVGNRSHVDRALQQKQQDELRQRLQSGGH